MNKRICKNIYCQKVLPYFLNGNREYCPGGCEYENKLRTLNEKNKQEREEKHIAKMDNILEELYDKFGSQQYVSSALLQCKGFDWRLSLQELEIQSLKVNLIRKYGYTLFNNETVLIWKI